MTKLLLFPAIAAAAWAQQASPANPDAENALRARAEQFYQLEVAKKFREAEAFVAPDTKDYFYDNGKPDIKAFKIDKIDFSPDGTRATVKLTATVLLVAPGVGAQEFQSTAPATWKLEDGQWFWYVDQNAEVDTPFGKWRPGNGAAGGATMPAGMPDLSNLQSLVSIDRTLLDLSSGNDTVTITNRLPGSITLSVGNHPNGLAVEIDKSSLATGEKAVVSFRATGDAQPSGEVHINALPIGQDFVVQIKPK